MSICRLTLAGIALLISAAPAIAQNWTGHRSQQPGASGYYTNSLGHQVPRPCGDWRTNQETTPGSATALCEDGTYSYSELPTHREPVLTTAVFFNTLSKRHED
jgi:hypothetical protein